MADIDLSLLTPRNEDVNDKIVVMKEGSPDTIGLIPTQRFSKASSPDRFIAFNDCVQITSDSIWNYGVISNGIFLDHANLYGGDGLGWVNVNFGANANAGLHLRTSTSAIQLGTGEARAIIRAQCAILSDAVNAGYYFRSGFIDTNATTGATGDPTDGVFFRYNHTLNGGRWEAVCRKSNVETSADTGVTVAAGTTYKLDVLVNAAGTSATFTINGTVVATITTNIPTGSTETTGVGLVIKRNIGTATVNGALWSIDYILADVAVTGAR